MGNNFKCRSLLELKLQDISIRAHYLINHLVFTVFLQGNAHHNFAKPMVASLNVLFFPTNNLKAQDIKPKIFSSPSYTFF